jgi:hypothetical protein
MWLAIIQTAKDNTLIFAVKAEKGPNHSLVHFQFLARRKAVV